VGIGQFFKDRITGSVTDDRIVLRRRRFWWRNDFAPVFEGRISEDGRAITGVFRPPIFGRLFLVGWFVLLLGLFLPIEITGIVKEGITGRHLQTIAMLALMVGFGLALPWLGWVFGRCDIKRITEFLQNAARRAGA
jgi:hypothetical protein